MVKFHCPRAAFDGIGPGGPHKPPYDGMAEWRSDGTCSYCGSIRGEEFVQLVESDHPVTPTDKSYKAYIDGHRKFYFQHLTEDQKQWFVDAVNRRLMKFEHPGHLYVLPYFVSQ